MGYGLQLALVLSASVAMAAERPSIGLLTEFPAGMPAAVRQEFRAETERALAATGTNLVWRQLSGSGLEQSFDRLVVLRFRGNCKDSPGLASWRSLPLGLTHVSNGKVLPFVEIDCQRVLAVIQAGPGQSPFGQPHATVGRALGRVAAHEIHHVLTASGAHDVDGLMKSAFDSRDLRGPELSFSAESLRRLKLSVGTATTQAAARIKADD